MLPVEVLQAVAPQVPLLHHGLHPMVASCLLLVLIGTILGTRHTHCRQNRCCIYDILQSQGCSCLFNDICFIADTFRFLNSCFSSAGYTHTPSAHPEYPPLRHHSHRRHRLRHQHSECIRISSIHLVYPQHRRHSHPRLAFLLQP